MNDKCLKNDKIKLELKLELRLELRCSKIKL